MEGLKQLVSDQEHRQEIVANGLDSYLSQRTFLSAIHTFPMFIAPFIDFFELNHRLGNRAGEFWSRFFIYQRNVNNSIHLLKWFAGELPEVNHQLVHMTTSFTVPQDCPCISSGSRPRQPSHGPCCVHPRPFDRQESSFEFEFYFPTNWWPGKPAIQSTCSICRERNQEPGCGRDQKVGK